MNSLRSVSKPIPSSGPDILAGLNADNSRVTWMEANWMFISWAFFLFGSGYLAATVPCRRRSVDDMSTSGTRRDRYRELWYGWLSVVMYCLHQSEEHGYDMRGWRYAFVPSLNYGPIHELYRDACSKAYDPLSCPLDPKITLYVNTVAIWIGFAGCMTVATLWSIDDRFLLVGSLNWGTAIINGIGGHFVPALLTASYNPGVAQSAIMVPLGIYVVCQTGNPLWLCISNGILFHALLIAGVKLTFHLHTPEALTAIVFTLTSGLLVPLGISTYMDTRRSRNKTL